MLPVGFDSPLMFTGWIQAFVKRYYLNNYSHCSFTAHVIQQNSVLNKQIEHLTTELGPLPPLRRCVISTRTPTVSSVHLCSLCHSTVSLVKMVNLQDFVGEDDTLMSGHHWMSISCLPTTQGECVGSWLSNPCPTLWTGWWGWWTLQELAETNHITRARCHQVEQNLLKKLKAEKLEVKLSTNHTILSISLLFLYEFERPCFHPWVNSPTNNVRCLTPLQERLCPWAILGKVSFPLPLQRSLVDGWVVMIFRHVLPLSNRAFAPSLPPLSSSAPHLLPQVQYGVFSLMDPLPGRVNVQYDGTFRSGQILGYQVYTQDNGERGNDQMPHRWSWGSWTGVDQLLGHWRMEIIWS